MHLCQPDYTYGNIDLFPIWTLEGNERADRAAIKAATGDNHPENLTVSVAWAKQEDTRMWEEAACR